MTITIKSNNDSFFKDDENFEISKILLELAAKLSNGIKMSTIYGKNKNIICNIKY